MGSLSLIFYIQVQMKKSIEIVYKILNISVFKDSKVYDKDLTEKERIKHVPKGFIYLGNFNPESVNGSIVAVMNLWVKVWDVVLKYNGLSKKQRNEIISNRFISFKEFLASFDKPVKQEGVKTRYQYSVKEGRNVPKYSHYTYEPEFISFEYGNGRRIKRNDFHRYYSNDESGYYKLLLESDIPIKSFFKRNLPYLVSDDDRKKHTYISGGSGSGKTELIKILIYANLKRTDQAIVIIEPHGDLCKQCVRWKEMYDDYQDRVIYIDPFLDDDYTPSINPFELKVKTERTVSSLTQQIIYAFEGFLKGNEFSINMETTLKYCIHVLLYMPNSSIIDLKRFMNDNENSDLIKLGLKSPNREHRNFFANEFQSKPLEQTKRAISMKISSFLSSSVFTRLMTRKTSFDLEYAINNGKIVIFNISKGMMGKDISNAYGRFVVAMVQFYALKRAETQESSRPHTHLFIDECQNYVSKDLEDILAETRKYKLFMT